MVGWSKKNLGGQRKEGYGVVQCWNEQMQTSHVKRTLWNNSASTVS